MRQSVQELMERYQNNLFAAAFNVCKSKEDAEAVLQDMKYLTIKYNDGYTMSDSKYVSM